VTVETAQGRALDLDTLYPWAHWIASNNKGWSPSEVTTAFLLNYISNNGHTWGYGGDQVTAWGAQVPPNISAPSASAVSGASMYNGNNFLVSGAPVGTSQGEAPSIGLVCSGYVHTAPAEANALQATVSGLFSTYFGGY